MIAMPNKTYWVADLMHEQELGVDDLVRASGVPKSVVEAIVEQRYTPAPDQRDRVSRALGVERSSIVWGHLCAVERHIHSPD